MARIVIVSPGPSSSEALVPDRERLVACRIDADGLWHCECRPGDPVYRARPEDCCPHLYALGSSPATRKEL